MKGVVETGEDGDSVREEEITWSPLAEIRRATEALAVQQVKPRQASGRDGGDGVGGVDAGVSLRHLSLIHWLIALVDMPRRQHANLPLHLSHAGKCICHPCVKSHASIPLSTTGLATGNVAMTAWNTLHKIFIVNLCASAFRTTLPAAVRGMSSRVSHFSKYTL
ncbi:unnamed protein product [Urochloa humidicola]